MEYELYVIYDSASGHYTVPMAQDNDTVAIRGFVNEGMKEGSVWNSHPQDFTLYRVGTYYLNTGEIIASQTPEKVCNLADYIRKEK